MEKERVMKRGNRGIQGSGAGAGRFTPRKLRARRGERVKEWRKQLNIIFITSPGGGHIQMCLCAEWVQDHIEKVIDD